MSSSPGSRSGPLFGVIGDLAKCKLLPGLYRWYLR